MIPNEVDALWSIQLSPQAKPHEHVNYLTNRNTSTQRNQAFWRMLIE
jgi:inner membrane protein